jgi:hypothetical protein
MIVITRLVLREQREVQYVYGCLLLIVLFIIALEAAAARTLPTF